MSPKDLADAQEYSADQTATPQKLAAIRPYERAYPLLKQVGATGFGPHSDNWGTVINGLTEYGLISPTSKIASENDVRNEVMKNLRQAAILFPGGARSDQGLGAALDSNPSTFFSKATNLNLILDQIGRAKQEAAAPIFAGGPKGYKDYKAGAHYFQTHPAGFVLPLMDKDQRAALKNSPDRAAIENTARKAMDRGMIPQPRAAGPTQEQQ